MNVKLLSTDLMTKLEGHIYVYLPNPRPRVLFWILPKFEMVHDNLHLLTLNVDQKELFYSKGVSKQWEYKLSIEM